MRLTFFKKLVITLVIPSLFAYLGFQLQKYLDDILKSREITGIRGGSSGIDWVSLLAKHRDNLPFIFSLFGALTSSSYIFFEDQLSSFLFQAIPGNWYSKINNRYFGAVERAQTIFQVQETVALIEAFDLQLNMSAAEKIDGYKILLADILRFDSKRKIFFGIIGFVSMLGYLFTANLFLFGQVIIALMSLIKEGKISRGVARIIVNMLRLKGVPVPDELEELVK